MSLASAMNLHRAVRAVSFVLAICLVLIPSVAAAQSVFYGAVTRDFARGPTDLYEVRIADGFLAGVELVASVDGVLVGEPAITGAGRYVLLTIAPGASDPSGARRLAFFDRTTRATGFMPGVPSEALPLIADSTRLRGWKVMGTSVVELSPTGARTIFSRGVPGQLDLALVGPSADGERLYLSTSAPNDGERRLLILSSSNGAVLHEVVGPPRLPALSDDDAYVYGVTVDLDSLNQYFVKVDVSTGLEVGRLLAYPPDQYGSAGTQSIVVDDRRRRAVVSLYPCEASGCSGIYWTIDTDSMTEVARLPTGGPPHSHLDIAGGHVVAVAERLIWPLGICGLGQLQVVSTSDGLERSRVGPFSSGTCVGSALATPPISTELGAPLVAGSTAVLSWTPVPGAVSYTVEAGSVTGSANLATFPVQAGTTLTVPNVPAGTYFVRVRAVNYVGPSAPSNEVVVVVP